MSESALPPSASTMLVILLGASAWPNSPGFQASKAFMHAAHGFRDYLLDPGGFRLPAANLLDLFDAPSGASDQLEQLESFLQQRSQALIATNQEAHDVLVYFVGHGGFVGSSHDFYLMPRRANASRSSLRASGLSIDALADVLREQARQARRYLLLDCCFAAAAFRSFLGGPDQTAIEKTLDAFAVQTRSSGFPGRGTVLLCSSDQKSPSLLLPDESCTMFSRALLDVLRDGDLHRTHPMSFRDIKELTEDRLMALPEENAPRPGLYSPDQSEGDVANVPLFPNSRAEEERRRQTEEAKRRQEKAEQARLAKEERARVAEEERVRKAEENRRRQAEAERTRLAEEEKERAHLAEMEQLKKAEVVLTALAKDPKARFATVHAFAQALSQAAETTRIVQTGDQVLSPAPAAVSATAEPILLVTHPAEVPPVTEAVDTPAVAPLAAADPVTHAEVILSAEASAPPTGSPSPVAEPFPLAAPSSRPRHSRRKAVLLGSVLIALLVLSTGLLFTTSTIKTQHDQSTATAQGSTATVQGSTATIRAIATKTASPHLTAIAQVTATMTASINAYNQYVTTHGIMAGFDPEHSGNNLFERILSPTTVYGLHQAWSFSTGRGISSSPAVTNGVVYVGSGDHQLYALDAATGTKKWSFSTGDWIDSSPTVTNGVVYVGSDDHQLYALDATTGTKKWSFSMGNWVSSSPTVANGVVYVGSFDRQLYALDAATGAKKWSFSTGDYVSSSPAVANGVVYVGSGDHHLYAFALSE